jgi:chromosome segregation ATPase
MGNLNLEVSSLKNKFGTKKKEKAILQVELGKEKDFHKEYKHNIKIWRKNMMENEHKIKGSIQKMHDENKELEAKTILMKSQAKELQELEKTTDVWETTERKWVEALFHYN